MTSDGGVRVDPWPLSRRSNAMTFVLNLTETQIEVLREALIYQA